MLKAPLGERGAGVVLRNLRIVCVCVCGGGEGWKSLARHTGVFLEARRWPAGLGTQL